jgi:hypothetical protein
MMERFVETRESADFCLLRLRDLEGRIKGKVGRGSCLSGQSGN